jgi:ATP synthase F1 gamma subunit
MPLVTQEKKRDLEDLEAVRFVASALFDVSAEKIGRLRAAFDRNSLFYNDLHDLYGSVRRTAADRGELPPEPRTVARKRVCVAFTSNVRFYGSVNADVMVAFLDQLAQDRSAGAIVIGRTGKAFLEDTENARGVAKVSHVSFEADEPTQEEIRHFLEQVAQYDEVRVFYPSFVSVFSQQVASVDIARIEADETDTPAGAPVDYLFEPELPQIIDFFERRVRYLLFQRVALESELARTASRLFAMNRAQDRADEEVKKVRRTIKKDEENFNDMRLLESFAAIARWKS